MVGASSHDDKARRPPYIAAMAACDSLNAGQFMLREGKWKLITYPLLCLLFSTVSSSQRALQ